MQEIQKNTILEYSNRAKYLAREYNESTFTSLEKWIREKAKNGTMRRWISYRSAMVWSLLNRKIDLKNYTHMDAVQILTNVKDLETVNKKQSHNTSRLKYKYIPQGIFEKLKIKVGKTNSRYDAIIIDWLDATILTGLRPGEWQHLRLQSSKNNPEKIKLIVKNLKSTHGRSFAPEREIIIQAPIKKLQPIFRMHEYFKQLKQEFINEIFQQIKKLDDTLDTKKINKPNGNYIDWNDLKLLILGSRRKVNNDVLEYLQINRWDKYYENRYKVLRNRLLFLNNSIGQKGKKKHITFYSARHQFKANMQAKGVDHYELAALMGHGSIATANINYARKVKGTPIDYEIKAPKKCIDLVYSWMQGKDYKMEYIPEPKETIQLK